MLSGLPGVYIGANLILHVPDLITTTLLGIMTIGFGLYSVFNPKLGQQQEIKQITRQRIIIGTIGLFLIGILNGSLTSGTGLFVILWLITFFGLDYKLAVATQYSVNLGSLLGGYIDAHLSSRRKPLDKTWL